MSYAQVWINDASMGVFQLMEALDEYFIKSRFGSAKGNLYKASGDESGRAPVGQTRSRQVAGGGLRRPGV